jgi:anti-sigma B factor antagonist
MPAFDVSLDVAHRCPVVRVDGELDIATAPQLERVLEEAASGGTPIVIDLTETTFCDSTGMTAILRAHKRAAADETGLIVVCPAENAEVTRVIDLLGFDRILRLSGTVEAAVEELCAGRDGAGTPTDRPS